MTTTETRLPVITVYHVGVGGPIDRFEVECPRHGRQMYPPDSRPLALDFAEAHVRCGLVRPPAPPQKSRRTPLVHVVHRPAAAPSADEGRSAPSHMGVTLGFAPPPRRDWRSPGAVRL